MSQNEPIQVISECHKPSLFKFYSLAKYGHLTVENLRRHKVYAQALENLNDPFEGWWYQSDTEAISSSHNREFRGRLERCGIYSLCLSTDSNFPISPESILLWSHYADSCKGFCVEFTNEILSTEGLEFKPSMVIYENYLPDKDSLNSYDLKSVKDKERILYWKGKVWEYENELRLCFSKANAFHKIPYGCIKTIYCGCKMNENDINVLKVLANELNVRCILLRRSIDNYGFEPTINDSLHGF